MHFRDEFGLFEKNLRGPERVVQVGAERFKRRRHGAVDHDRAASGHQVGEGMKNGWSHSVRCFEQWNADILSIARVLFFSSLDVAHEREGFPECKDFAWWKRA